MVEVCISEEFHASCPLDSVILINSAEYGRMEVGRCIMKPDEFLGCTNDVLPILDRRCSGKQKCNFLLITHDDIEAANENCLQILMKYLKVDYSCIIGTVLCLYVLFSLFDYCNLFSFIDVYNIFLPFAIFFIEVALSIRLARIKLRTSQLFFANPHIPVP